jgi:Lar family restriction alleviation protein
MGRHHAVGNVEAGRNFNHSRHSAADRLDRFRRFYRESAVMSGDVKPGTALEACPFCGCEELHRFLTDTRWKQICCPQCGVGQPNATYVAAAEAIAAWNQRTPDPALLARIEVLEGALQTISAIPGNVNHDRPGGAGDAQMRGGMVMTMKAFAEAVLGHD